MKSEVPKVLHEVCGLPMVDHVGRGMRGAGVAKPILVVGFGGDQVQARLGEAYDYVWQHEQLGTGHAVQQALPLLVGHDGPIIVACGDTPLVGREAFETLIASHRDSGAVATLASAYFENPFGYGRIVRAEDGSVTAIVEHRDATEAQRQIKEINAALYCIDGPTLLRLAPQLKNENDQKEFYLTDVIAMIVAEGCKVSACVYDDPAVTVGVNDRWQLAEADKMLRHRILKRHAVAGVTLRDIDSIFIGPDVAIEPDAIIEPGTMLVGHTRIGSWAVIGPNSRVENSEIGAHAKVSMSLVVRSTVGAHSSVGPFAHLRPGSHLGASVKVGNFVEVKNATFEDGAKASHLSYIGDASIGANANIGAGTITCNYDGFKKSRTEIGADAFVGSNSTLVAPLSIGAGAMIAAGSVVTHTVPDGAAAFGRARQETKEGWATEFRRKKSTNPSKKEA